MSFLKPKLFEEFARKIIELIGIAKVRKISTHHFGKSAGERNLVFENVPTAFFSFLTYFTRGSGFFWPAPVSTVMIGRIIDNDADNVNPVASIIVSERVERVV